MSSVPFSSLWKPSNIQIIVQSNNQNSNSSLVAGLYSAISSSSNASAAYSAVTAAIMTETLSNLKVVKVSPVRRSIVTAHPVEDGTTISDCKINLPIEITIDAICPSQQDFDNVVNLYSDPSTLYTIYARFDSVQNCVLAEVPYEIDSGMLSSVQVRMRFIQLISVSTVVSGLGSNDVAETSDSSTTAVGSIQPKAQPTVTQASAAVLSSGNF